MQSSGNWRTNKLPEASTECLDEKEWACRPGRRLMKLLSAMVYCDVKEIPQTPAPVDIDPLSFLQSRAFLGILKFNLKSGQQAYPHLLFLPKSA